MNELESLLKRYTIYSVIIIGSLILGTLFISDATFLAGMAVGAIFSLLNLYSTYFQVKRLTSSVMDSKVRFSFGTIGRIIVVLLALLIAEEFPQYLDLTGVIIGLAFKYCILLIDPIFYFRTRSTG
ncbi:ATP synthase subunit I [Salipaludibacillus agaradhaerens]|jgi:ATP synthase protein I|uniref:ATP synthase subunit I n=1 Tax=Salipaludibacillus agaradhaerens TaxID=76935 RepID=UPI000998D42D|nr:ATP synthase subunit I [Salipaludibacillus agaradhaerens]MCR6108232.1 ATP synthase subunit I [Salipaludibacillus agaradhaerens]MCR6120257.1 ATP synthase subunit I [Salipaludibacillus agaradhaerens]UJW59277.1 ATP synthase subunit I [Bacillus sp. A116_S68]